MRRIRFIILLTIFCLFCLRPVLAGGVEGIYDTTKGEMVIRTVEGRLHLEFPLYGITGEPRHSLTTLKSNWKEGGNNGTLEIQFTPDFTSFTGTWTSPGGKSRWNGAKLSDTFVQSLYDTNWGMIKMVQQGCRIAGTYPSGGFIRGVLRGNRAVGQWSQPGGSGTFTLYFSAGARTFSGRWQDPFTGNHGEWSGRFPGKEQDAKQQPR